MTKKSINVVVKSRLKKVKRKDVFCQCCGSLEMYKVPLPALIKETEKNWVIQCGKCKTPTYYTAEYIIKNLERFSNYENYKRVITNYRKMCDQWELEGKQNPHMLPGAKMRINPSQSFIHYFDKSED